MRFRLSLLITLVAALALSAVAVAGNGSPPENRGKPEQSRAQKPGVCHKKRAVLLHGTFVEAGTDSFTMNVRRANRHGRALTGEQTVMVDDKTRMKRRGKKGKAALADLVKDDRLHLLARCRPGETAGSFTLLARLVLARPAKPKPAQPESE